MSATKTLHFRPKEFNELLSRLGLHQFWNGKEGDNLLVLCIAEPPDNAAMLFHQQRGCCDGTDIKACYLKLEADRLEAEKALKAERKAKRSKKVNPRHEFEGTE